MALRHTYGCNLAYFSARFFTDVEHMTAHSWDPEKIGSSTMVLSDKGCTDPAGAGFLVASASKVDPACAQETILDNIACWYDHCFH